MWGQNRHGPPPYYDPNPNPLPTAPYGSMYPNPNFSNPTPYSGPDPSVPTLSHRGVPSPSGPAGSTSGPAGSGPGYGGSGYGIPPPTYGFQPPAGAPGPIPAPAGAVPVYGNQAPYHPGGMTGEDGWVGVQHGGPFPQGAVQAMDRQLNNSDQTAKNCYVALWNKDGEPVFGRAWNNKGKIEAWFPHGGHEHHSGNLSPSTFSILTYYGPPNQPFRYAWVPVTQMNSMCQPVRQGEYSPMVIPDLQIGSFRGELLGKGNLTRRMAWVSHAGKEHHFGDQKFENSFVLCRVPL